MTPHQAQCDPSLVGRYLDRQLADEEESALELHLDRCETCRRALDEKAAEGSWWSEASKFLAADEWDGPPSLPPGLSTAGFEHEPHVDSENLIRRLSAWLDPTDDPHSLGRFGGCEIAGVIGEGGMGVVLKGQEPALNRYVAIKVLAPHLASNGAARQRFSREAQAAAAVLHENVIAIHRVDESRGLPYLVMPYIAGVSLQKRLDQEGPLPLLAILRISRQIAAGLAAAHAQGLVHRDVKPANILLERGVERVTLTDFGLARAVDDATLTRSGVIAGTPQFMSPEQARGEPVDVCSDLFSLGSVMYAMCTGRPPFRAETAYGILRRITDSEPRPIREINAAIPDWLEAIVRRLHAKLPAERFQSPAELADLLEKCLAHVQQPTTVPLPAMPFIPPAATFRARDRVAQRLAARTRRIALALAVAACAAWAVWQFWPEAGPTQSQSGDGAPQAEPESASLAERWNDAVGMELDSIGPSLERLNREIDKDINSDFDFPPESDQ